MFRFGAPTAIAWTRMLCSTKFSARAVFPGRRCWCFLSCFGLWASSWAALARRRRLRVPQARPLRKAPTLPAQTRRPLSCSSATTQSFQRPRVQPSPLRVRRLRPWYQALRLLFSPQLLNLQPLSLRPPNKQRPRPLTAIACPSVSKTPSFFRTFRQVRGLSSCNRRSRHDTHRCPREGGRRRADLNKRGRKSAMAWAVVVRNAA